MRKEVPQMDLGFLTAPKPGTFGGVFTPKALHKLKQVGKHKQYVFG